MAGWGLALALAGVIALLPATPTTRHATIAELAFRPAELHVTAGDTVTWTNNDLVPHTVTAVDGRWSSGEIPPGGTFSVPFEGSDAIGYECEYHPTMVGELRPSR